MDNQMLISMVSSSSVSENKGTSKREGDAGAFSQALEEATSSESSKAEKGKDLISEKETPQTEAQRRKEEAADKAQARAEQARLTQNPRSTNPRAMMYQMAYRNPDAMSLAERQSLKLDKPSVNLTQLQNAVSGQTMLTSKGELSFAQLSNMTKQAAATSPKDFLEALTKETGADKKDAAKSATATEAGQAAASSKGESKSATADTNLAATAPNQADQAQNAQPTAQAQRTMKRQEVINQIVTHMELRNLANKDELSLKLNPEYLGELKIKLTQTKDGEVTAHFMTTSDETREVLDESKAELRKRVEEKGISFGRIEVDLVDELA